MTNEKRPLVSIVIPFYSNVKWLKEALESVFNQDYINYEIILINDGSTEDISFLLDKYRKKIVYFFQENQGVSVARNKGISIAKGEFVAFLDSDDLWKPNKLSIQVKKMLQYDADWSYTNFEVFGEEIQTKEKWMKPFKTEGLYSNHSPYIGTPTVMIRRHILVGDKGFSFSHDLKYGEDTFLWEQIQHSYKILYLPDVLSAVRIRGNNAGKRAVVQLRAKVLIWNKCIKEIPNFKKESSFLYRTGIGLCKFGMLFVKDNKTKVNEIIARFFYIIPYLLFKLDRKINIKKID